MHAVLIWSFAVAVAYWPGLPAAAQVPRYAVIAIGVPLISRLDPSAVAWRFWWLLAGGLGYAALSVSWAPDHLDGALQLFFLASFALVFVAAAGFETIEPAMAGLALGIGVSVVLCVVQIGLNWPQMAHLNVPSGLFYNREDLAEVAAPVAVCLICWRRYALASLPAAAVILCQSRIGALATALGLLYAWKASARIKAAALAFLALAASASVWMDASKLLSAEARIAIWGWSARQVTFWGHGLGWFQAASPMEYAHSEPLQMADELGVAALLFMAIPALIFIEGRGNRVERAVLTAVCVEAAVSFPLHQPAAGFVAALVAGYLAGAGREFRVLRSFRGIRDGANLGRPAPFGRGLGYSECRGRVVSVR